ncbi:MAG: hypothetical protein EZS28_032664 [Streblomastix strix]|uniref:Uncharacterized protein n=1 Tax=Streblomastix strix TaxID=222440 RepID=A0A5J4UMR2_9EUKA|nr:MAG: hypothetical protein EZS28_032664 [Streblomastix strix]
MSDEKLLATFKSTQHFIDNEKIQYNGQYWIQHRFQSIARNDEADAKQSEPRDDSAVRSEQMKLDRQTTLPAGYGAHISALDEDFAISETDVNDGCDYFFYNKSSYVRRTIAKGPVNGDYIMFSVRELQEMIRLTENSPSYLLADLCLKNDDD